MKKIFYLLIFFCIIVISCNDKPQLTNEEKTKIMAIADLQQENKFSDTMISAKTIAELQVKIDSAWWRGWRPCTDVPTHIDNIAAYQYLKKSNKDNMSKH